MNPLNPKAEVIPLWDIYSAVSLARLLEPLALQGGYHVALGGGCLHKGSSSKDVDIFLYPRKRGKNSFYKSKDAMMTYLNGWEKIDHTDPDNSGGADTKVVYKTSFEGKRVDVIILE